MLRSVRTPVFDEFNELRNSMSSCPAKSAFVIGSTGGVELRSAAGEIATSITSITSITSVMSGTIEDGMAEWI